MEVLQEIKNRTTIISLLVIYLKRTKVEIKKDELQFSLQYYL